MGRRRHGLDGAEAVSIEHSTVHILRTKDELQDAVQRAVEFDQRTAETLRSRSRHYEELVTGRWNEREGTPGGRSSPSRDPRAARHQPSEAAAVPTRSTPHA